MNNRAVIRLATLDDAAEILEIYRPFVENTVVTFEEVVPSLGDFRSRLDGIMSTCPYLVCEVDGRVVGYAYASEYRSRASYRWNKEVTVYIHPDYHRRNIGRALYTAMIEILKKLNIGNLLAVITLPNEGSTKLHESLGFKPCAVFNNVGYKQGKWHQVGWWELSLLDDVSKIPDEPIPFAEYLKNHQVEEILVDSARMIKIS